MLALHEQLADNNALENLYAELRWVEDAASTQHGVDVFNLPIIHYKKFGLV